MEPWELTKPELDGLEGGDYATNGEMFRAIATEAGQKLADRTQQLLNDWAYLDDAEFAQKHQMKKTFLPHLYAEWLKGQL